MPSMSLKQSSIESLFIPHPLLSPISVSDPLFPHLIIADPCAAPPLTLWSLCCPLTLSSLVYLMCPHILSMGPSGVTPTISYLLPLQFPQFHHRSFCCPLTCFSVPLLSPCFYF